MTGLAELAPEIRDDAVGPEIMLAQDHLLDEQRREVAAGRVLREPCDYRGILIRREGMGQKRRGIPDNIALKAKAQIET
jgi:hypothetical protein